MFLILRLFNSILFVIANLAFALYTLQRFFRAMKVHYHLVDEVEEYSLLVDQSRASLDYVGAKVMEAMKEMESDIGKEVYVTHNLTKLSAKIASVSKRFNDLEEGIIELARLSHNMENATVETPSDINEEVRRILISLKRNKSSAAEQQQQQQLQQQHQQQLLLQQQQQQQQQEQKSVRKRSSRRIKSSKVSHISHDAGQVESFQQQQLVASNPVTKFSVVQPTTTRHQPGSRSPGLVPDVMLLGEQRRSPVDKPIGFRPPWMCEV